MKDAKIMYGFFSRKALSMGNPSFIYAVPQLTDSLEEYTAVEVTTVTSDPLGRSYRWKDKVFVGPVDRFLSEGMPRRLI